MRNKFFVSVLISTVVLFSGVAYADVAINSTNFPDKIFREYVKQFDTNGNNSFSAAEIKAVESIVASNMGISNLKGIEKFTALKYLDCSNNNLKSLSLTKNTKLQDLKANNNQLTSVNITKNTALRILDVNDNQLQNLDVTKNTALEYFYCMHNQLTKLNVTQNIALRELWCHWNQLPSLNVTKNTNLLELGVFDNKLTKIDVSKNAKLNLLHIGQNQLTTLNVSKNKKLQNLGCETNQLKSLNLTQNQELQRLACSWNQITSLNLTTNQALKILDCQYNQLTKLDLKVNWQLEELVCNDNKLASLIFNGGEGNLRHLYCYNNILKTLDVSNEPGNLKTIECYSNKLTSLKLGNAWNLRTLDCENNNISKIDISGCPNLRRIFTDDDVAFIEEVIEGDLSDSGVVGQEYSSTVSVKGGAWPYTWKRLSGKMPTGLKLTYADNYATISGTPTQANKYEFYLQVTDNNGLKAKKKFTIKISEAETTTSNSKKSAKDISSDTKKSTQQKGSSTSTEKLKNENVKGKDTGSLSFGTENFAVVNYGAGEIVEGSFSSKTRLDVIGENKLWQGTDKDEDLIKVSANLPVNFKIGTWINTDGSEIKTKIPPKDIEILIDEKVFDDVKVTDEGEFTIPAEIVTDDFKIQALGNLNNKILLETQELLIAVEKE